MKGGHLLQSSPVQQQMMVAGNPTNWPWSTSTTIRPPPPPSSHQDQLLPNFFIFPPNFTTTLSSSFSSSPLPSPSWLDTQDHPHHLPPESWSQLLLGGLVVGDEDKGSQMMMMNQLQQGINNKFDNNHIKQESSAGSYVSCYDANQAPVDNWPHHQIMANTTNNSPSDDVGLRHPPPLPTDPSPESNSINRSGGGGIAKKARVQPSSSSPSTQSALPLKVVRKEKVGDRITTLHQIVSPFGKTDTASVLLEAIGYIRFLQSQIEALSLPYLGSGSSSLRQQHHYQHSVQGERNCVFPEHPGQLLNDSSRKRKATSDQQECYNDDEAKKDLRSRGLCLVPVSCTMQVGNENGADYWAPSLGGGFR